MVDDEDQRRDRGGVDTEDGREAERQTEAGQSRYEFLRHVAGGRFDLFHHVGMIVLLVIAGVAGGYALVDGLFLLQALPLGGMPKWPFIVVALVAAGPSFLAGRGAPLFERVGMTLVTSAALTWAVYPAMLRINAMTGEETMVTYQPTAIGAFEHPDGDYPALDLTGLGINEYLEEHGDQRAHRFVLVKGDLGFYQLDLWPLYAVTSQFYRGRQGAAGDQ